MAGGSSVPAPKVTRMPNATDPAIAAARARAQQARQNSTGRSSTILSDALKGLNGSAGMLGR